MKHLTTLLLVIVLVILISVPTFGQYKMTRAEIYDNWNDLELTKTTGNGRLTWLPNGMGYLESEKDSKTGKLVFYKTSPKNKKRSRLFDKKTEAAILNQYSQLTSKSGAELPFKSFSYLDDNSGIRFRVSNVG